ncbi:MAG: molybdopterin-dependent oxidoreductase [Desulfobulbaceae bacterium]|nr:molybdopterin-dependent oxidoreductase [Desulfobulbaceae bacterium]
MKNIDAKSHLRGESIYVDDIPVREGTLYAAVFGSPMAHGLIKKLDLDAARAMDGVHGVLTACDIPGVNQIGGIVEDELLLADHELHYIGMPVAIVVAESEGIAKRAVAAIRIEIDELPVVVDPRQAHGVQDYLTAPRTFAIGDPAEVWSECSRVVSGRADIGGQEHVYLETQGTYVFPLESGNLKIHTSTQAPTHVQRMVARVLGTAMHRIEVDVIRIGGGFGGKEDQATPWACMATLAAHILNRPVKLILSRADDIRMTGKRHPYSFDFRIGLDRDHKIRAYEVDCFQNGGAAADLSPAIMERSLFHGSGSYYLPNAKITVYSCRTNLPPNTAFRGFGAPQAMFVLEAAIFKAAEELGVAPEVIQRANLLQDGDLFPYGQQAEGCRAVTCWEELEQTHGMEPLKEEVALFNRENSLRKKGYALFPLCFGISFTNTMLNQGRALVHVYTDGSVTVTTGVIEMGQGVNTKILQVAARTLGVSPGRIRVESTNTTRVANSSPTAASTGADLNGNATLLACRAIVGRLQRVAAQELGCSDTPERISFCDERVFIDAMPTAFTWFELISRAYARRVSLSEHAHYATPEIYFDKEKEKGHPFAYHVYGTVITTVTVDCVRGTYEIDAMRVVHDFGSSMNPDLDLGQIEGGIAQGVGLMTIEELLVNEQGRLVYDSLSSYKVPDIYSVPKLVDIVPLDSEPSPHAVFGSKAVGEPPLCYGISVYFALVRAMREFNPQFSLQLSAPMTHQKCLLSLYENL